MADDGWRFHVGVSTERPQRPQPFPILDRFWSLDALHLDLPRLNCTRDEEVDLYG